MVRAAMVRQSGAGSGEALTIMGIAIYFTFLGLLANAAGYTATSISSFTGSISDINLGILTFLFDILAWVIMVIGAYFSMIAFTVTGDIPVWIGMFAIIPVVLGLGWIIIVMIRG